MLRLAIQLKIECKRCDLDFKKLRWMYIGRIKKIKEIEHNNIHKKQQSNRMRAHIHRQQKTYQ